MAGVGKAGFVTSAFSSGLIGATNYFKKKSHYTKEVDEYEKRNAMNHQEEERIMQKWKDILNGTTRATWRQKQQAKKQLKKYASTTVQALRDTKTLSDSLMDLVSLPTQNLTPMQRNQLHERLIHSYARVKLFKGQGRNFLSSQTEAQAEQDMASLEKAIDLGVRRAGLTSRDQIDDDNQPLTALVNGQTISVKTVTRTLTDDYEKRLKTFKTRRGRLARNAGLSAAALSFGTSFALQKVF